ncbi:MAG: 4-hydroxybutyrate coenzyme A transferase, partial [Elusimicrobiota bacterium]|nr:4-hydroxybutyrate coenzyme A transferase [Elusimicrobiota bacterium]
MKELTAAKALEPLRSGQRVLVGSGAAAPQELVAALAVRAMSLSDVEVLHLMTLAQAPYASPSFKGHVRHNALFIGANTR